jgi:tetratricopeptide (TPR) repeat protein
MTIERKRLPIDAPIASVPPKSGPAMRLDSVLRDVGLASVSPSALEKASVLDHAYGEYCQCLESGPPPEADDFCERYPRYKSSLRRLLDMHSRLDEGGLQSARSVSLRWPKPGDSFLGFALQQELGRGAFARVFLATEPALGDRLVAIKISLKGAAEAQTLGRLDHPNIVPIHAVQNDDYSGLSVVCMPYLGSATLCDVLDRAFAGPCRPARARVILEVGRDLGPSDEAMSGQSAPSSWLQNGTYVDGVVYLGAQLADALSFVHARGICHRDLKPSNILLLPDGTPMLLDFNLAFDKQSGEPGLGGTLPYMAPEQLLAWNRADKECCLAEQADLFSLGVILYELLSGIHPFGPIPSNHLTPETRTLLIQRQRRLPKRLREANPQVDHSVAQVIERCLAFEPAGRPSAAEVRDAFRRRLKRKRRLRAVRLLLGAAVIVLVTGATGSYFFRTGPLLEQGLTAYRQGRDDQAIRFLNRALNADPENLEALWTRGRIWKRRGEFDLAFGDFLMADRVRASPLIKTCIGYCENRRKQHGSAIRWYEEALAADIAPAGAVYNNLGYSYLQLNRLSEAKTKLDQAIKLNPYLQPAFHNRALADLSLSEKNPGYVPQVGIKDVETDRPIRSPEVRGYVPLAGIKDVETALQLGPVTAELAYDAARLYAKAAETNPSLVEKALDHLQTALERGADPKRLEKDELLRMLRSSDRFRDMAKQTVVSKTSQKNAVRLIDPVADGTHP